MVSKIIDLTPNTISVIGKGIKILPTTEAVDLTVEPNRFVFSIDVNAKIGTTESGKVYKGKVDHQRIRVDGRVFKLNAYVLEEIFEAPVPKAKASKKLTL